MMLKVLNQNNCTAGSTVISKVFPHSLNSVALKLSDPIV